MTVLITGGTGFVGQRLLPHFDNPLITSRNRDRALTKLGKRVGDVIQWSPMDKPLAIPAEHSVTAIVNLMGDSIAEGRWTEEKKKRIRDSRVIGTKKIVEAVSQMEKKPDVVVSASAIGYYGDTGETIVTESAAKGSGFLPDVSDEWERATDGLTELGVRVVKLRIGIVLGADGGALEKMIPLFRMGLGGKLGSGQQWFPWIHVDDLVGMIKWAVDTPNAEGVYNATAPNPVRNGEFTQALASSVNRWALLPAPKFGLKLALGEFAESLFFSQCVVPEKAKSEGFDFQFAELEPALKNIVG